jgi:hypothetical protein
MKDSWALWMMRKQFTLQMATNSWLIWCMYLHTRPSRYFVSRETGLMGLCEASIGAFAVNSRGRLTSGYSYLSESTIVNVK